MEDNIKSVVTVPEGSNSDLRRHLGLKDTDDLRVSYIPGPGDLAGTFNHWQANRHDPRVPTIAYSLMFYELMARLKAECQIVSLHPIDSIVRSEQSQFHFERVTQAPYQNSFGYFFSQYLFARDLVSIVERFDPHIIVTSTHNPASSWKRLAKGRKLILTAHNTFWPKMRPPQSVKSRLRKAMLASHAKALDGAVCISHECARQISVLTDGQVQGEVACPQIVETFPIEQRGQARNLLYLGRIEESKGIFLLIDVFEQLAKQHLELSLVIAGEGGAVPNLLARLGQSHFSDRIKFIGKADSAGVHKALAASDLLICPTMKSFNEGLAVVGFEAAAHGIPTLLSSVVPAAELLGESCTIYEADDAVDLHRSLSQLIENDSDYLDRRAATSAVRNMIYDRSLSWGSKLLRVLMTS